MKKALKRIISLLIVLIMMLPAQAFAITTGNENWEAAKAFIYSAIKAGKQTVDIQKFNISTDNIDTLVQHVRDQYPDLFYAEITNYTYIGTKVYGLQFEYNELNTAEAKQKYEEAVNTALLSVNDRMTDLQKAIVLHDYIVRNTKYDEKISFSSHNAYAVLVDKVAVCDGYTKAYMDLLNRCGIENYLVRSMAMDHVWTHIQINGQWYNIDITWDDPTPDRGDSTSYSYFMFSDAAFKNKKHYDWSEYYSCTDTSYDNANNWAHFLSEIPKGSGVFEDVFSSDYFCKPVLWANSEGIAYGTGATTFSPYASCTRSQAMTFLWRSAGSPAPTSNENPFDDVKPGDYFYEAVLWAVEQGITYGINDHQFGSLRTCSNAEIITLLWRAKGSEMPKNEVTEYQGCYYENSVAWAMEKGMIESIPKEFVPQDDSPRADIVSYLYLCR